MRLAVDNLADAVTIHDATGNLLYANEATARMMGMTLDEVLSAAPGAWTEHFAMYDENGRELPLEELPGRRVFFGETPDPLLVRSVARADGSWQWVRIKASPLLDSEGRVTAAVNVSEEVTEVKEAELGQRLLAEAGATLAASLDYEKTLQDVAQLTGRADAAVDRVNDAFLDMDGSSLCTLAALRLPGGELGGQVEILSAGHPLPYLVSEDGGATPLGTTGPLLGFVRSPRWPRAAAEVAPGEAVVLFSDGVLDTMNDERRLFGEHRLVDVLRSGPVKSAAELVERLDRALLDFQGSEQRDDVAVLVLRRER